MAKYLDEGLIIHEREKNALIFGTVIWEAAAALAKYFAWQAGRGTTWHGCNVLELGAGTGILGLMLGKFGARVVLTDHEPRVMELLAQNIAANGLKHTVTSKVLDWADPVSFLQHETWDVIVAGDVLYRGTTTHFLKALCDHMSESSVCFLAYSHFLTVIDETLEFFPRACRNGLHLCRLQDAAGRCIGAADGQDLSVFEGCDWVELHGNDVLAAVKSAEFSDANTEKVQLFRFSRLPRSQGPSINCDFRGSRL